MAEEKEEKIVVIATHGGEDPERATFPFVVANAAPQLSWFRHNSPRPFQSRQARFHHGR